MPPRGPSASSLSIYELSTQKVRGFTHRSTPSQGQDAEAQRRDPAGPRAEVLAGWLAGWVGRAEANPVEHAGLQAVLELPARGTLADNLAEIASTEHYTDQELETGLARTREELVLAREQPGDAAAARAAAHVFIADFIVACLITPKRLRGAEAVPADVTRRGPPAASGA
eukprot:SAG22_NODE_8326_length_664_cov_1.111504_1_plen_169_part_10